LFADTVLINTRIYTMDEEMPEVEALVIRGEKIVYAGTLMSLIFGVRLFYPAS